MTLCIYSIPLEFHSEEILQVENSKTTPSKSLKSPKTKTYKIGAGGSFNIFLQKMAL